MGAGPRIDWVVERRSQGPSPTLRPSQAAAARRPLAPAAACRRDWARRSQTEAEPEGRRTAAADVRKRATTATPRILQGLRRRRRWRIAFGRARSGVLARSSLRPAVCRARADSAETAQLRRRMPGLLEEGAEGTRLEAAQEVARTAGAPVRRTPPVRAAQRERRWRAG